MKLKRLFSDPSFILLLTTNVLIAYEYRRNPGMDGMVMMLYWAQSVMIGGVFFFRMILSPRSNPLETAKGIGCMPWFFLFHYGMFHLVYLVFITIGTASGAHYWANSSLRLFFYISLLSLLAGNIIDFVRFYRQDKKTGYGPGSFAFAPYVRIIPMHLFIIFGGIGNVKGWSFDYFIILKTIADILTYLVVYKPLRDKEDTTPYI